MLQATKYVPTDSYWTEEFGLKKSGHMNEQMFVWISARAGSAIVRIHFSVTDIVIVLWWFFSVHLNYNALLKDMAINLKISCVSLMFMLMC